MTIREIFQFQLFFYLCGNHLNCVFFLGYKRMPMQPGRFHELCNMFLRQLKCFASSSYRHCWIQAATAADASASNAVWLHSCTRHYLRPL